ncbi:hypothetical protein HDV05_006603 [Chytridiales sp. JEL 0842]|nr:hypothetical protein HDV05_006603 [Chytridiales sp. JEL 0842]
MGNIVSGADDDHLGITSQDEVAQAAPEAVQDDQDDDLGEDVTIWARDEKVVRSINEEHKNSKYMPTISLSPNLKATTDLNGETICSVNVIIFSIPTQHMRNTLERVKPYITSSHLLIFVNKGIEISTGLLPSDIVIEVLGESIGKKATFLSGPSFAIEVVKRQPTCVAVASAVKARALRTQRLFHAPHFRVYTTLDVTGVEVSGALKNVIALASGACAGMGYQQNSRAAIITRGLAEIIRIGVKMGADPLTFAGLAGVGDLMMTASSEKSRNFTVGYRLGKGEKLDYIIETLGSVAEGVETTKAAYALCRKLDVDSPLCDSVYSVLFQDKDIVTAVKELMERDPSHEMRGIRRLSIS